MLNKIKKIFNKTNHWLGYSPPGSLTSKGWRLFKQEFKEHAPIRFWIHYTFPSYYRPIKWTYDDVTWWIRYRTTNVYHKVNTGLPPGYAELDNKMLFTNFTMLKRFVECEIAYKQSWSDDEYKHRTRYTKYIPFYKYFKPFCEPALGIKHLDWEATLDDPSLPPYEQSPQQATAARETKLLYIWWTQTRPARKEAGPGPEYSDQGLGLFAILDNDFDKNAPDYVEHAQHWKLNEELREKWDTEDDEMLVRLINHRRSLWS